MNSPAPAMVNVDPSVQRDELAGSTQSTSDVYSRIAEELRKQYGLTLDRRRIAIVNDGNVSKEVEECFLRLGEPLQDYTLTPFREGCKKEVDELVELMNHPLVYPSLENPPFPYTAQDGRGFIGSLTDNGKLWQDAILHSSSPKELNSRLNGNPFAVIRFDPASSPEKSKGIGQCMLRGTGSDPELPDFRFKSWSIGYGLHPDYASRGLMTACLRAQIAFVNTVCSILDQAMPLTLPKTKATSSIPPRFQADVWEHNKGSLKVMEKCGLHIRNKRQDAKKRKYGFRDGGKSAGVLPPEVIGTDIWVYKMERCEKMKPTSNMIFNQDAHEQYC